MELYLALFIFVLVVQMGINVALFCLYLGVVDYVKH